MTLPFVFTGVMVFELVWLVLGVMWLIFHYHDCPVGLPKNIMMGEYGCFHRQTLNLVDHLELSRILPLQHSNVLTLLISGMVISNWILFLCVVLTVWCSFDAAGRSWVKMKKYQRSMREAESRFQYKRSGSRNRNWRQRWGFDFVLSNYLTKENLQTSLLYSPCVWQKSDASIPRELEFEVQNPLLLHAWC